MGFSDFGFSDTLLEGLDSMNFKEPTPIQVQAIPEILKGKDIIASTATKLTRKNVAAEDEGVIACIQLDNRSPTHCGPIHEDQSVVTGTTKDGASTEGATQADQIGTGAKLNGLNATATNHAGIGCKSSKYN